MKTAKLQFGGTFLGVVIGLMLGLGAALAVALYVTKVPIPFTNKGATKSTAEQDAQESQKNKNWDPNAPLYGKNPAKPSASGTVGTLTTATTDLIPPVAAASASKATASAAKAAVSAPKVAASAPKSSADPLGDLAKAKAAGTSPAVVSGGADPFTYFVQAGAFRTTEDAEAQKAKLTMAGFEARITEREQSGRTVFRVRVGPMEKKDDADKTKEKLDGAGFETAIVRVQR